MNSVGEGLDPPKNLKHIAMLEFFHKHRNIRFETRCVIGRVKTLPYRYFCFPYIPKQQFSAQNGKLTQLTKKHTLI